MTPQNLVLFRPKRHARRDATFVAPLKTEGWYLAEARAGAATISEVFSLVRAVVAVKTLSLAAPEAMQPSKRVPFTVSASNWRLQTANLQVWKLGGGTNTGVAGHRPPQKSKARRRRPQHHQPIRAVVGAGPVSGPGVGGQPPSLDYVRISDMGLAVKRAPHEILVYAVSLTTGPPIERRLRASR